MNCKKCYIPSFSSVILHLVQPPTTAAVAEKTFLCHFEGDPSLGKQEMLLSFGEVPALLLCLLPMTLGTCQEGRLAQDPC